MVASQVSVLTKTQTFQSQLHFPVSLPEDVAVDHLEFEFSDVFGPAPIEIPSDVNDVNHENLTSVDLGDLVYNDPKVIFRRSHSLVGPSAFISPSLKLSKLVLRETDDSEELLECVTGETMEQCSESSRADTGKDVGCEGHFTMETKVSLEDFEIMKLVGQGAFGKVFQVRKKCSSEIYAMKVMRKDKIMEQNHAEYMKAERDILTMIDHPFIVQLRYSFQTKYRLYLVLNFVNGGHLFFQLYHQGLFREDLARIYAAEIISAVSHLHTNGIMHRDLKPENILLDADGHVVLTDFGLAKQFRENERSNSMCGTVEYMAPEIVMGKGHDKAADWWSVGVLIFEMLTGKPPFVGNREKIQQKIVKDKIKLPGYLTSEAHALLKGLLQKDPSKRLGGGATGSEEIKRHKWFKRINWKKLEARELNPSFRPEVAGNHCTSNFEKRWTDMPVVDSPAASPKANGNLIFKDFTYVRPPASFLQRSTPLNGQV
ncbi:Serine/threonine-protein kinase AtPK2/AtPK19 [Dionaea muscipula]